MKIIYIKKFFSVCISRWFVKLGHKIEILIEDHLTPTNNLNLKRLKGDKFL